MKNLTMKKVGITALVLVITTVINLAMQLQFNGFSFAAVNLQRLTFDSLRLAVIVYLAVWSCSVYNKNKNKEEQ